MRSTIYWDVAERLDELEKVKLLRATWGPESTPHQDNTHLHRVSSACGEEVQVELLRLALIRLASRIKSNRTFQSKAY